TRTSALPLHDALPISCGDGKEGRRETGPGSASGAGTVTGKTRAREAGCRGTEAAAAPAGDRETRTREACRRSAQARGRLRGFGRSEEHTSELQSLAYL